MLLWTESWKRHCLTSVCLGHAEGKMSASYIYTTFAFWGITRSFPTAIQHLTFQHGSGLFFFFSPTLIFPFCGNSHPMEWSHISLQLRFTQASSLPLCCQPTVYLPWNDVHSSPQPHVSKLTVPCASHHSLCFMSVCLSIIQACDTNSTVTDPLYPLKYPSPWAPRATYTFSLLMKYLVK